MSTYSANITQKVNRAISGSTTVNSNAYAIVDYKVTGESLSGTTSDDQFIAAPAPAHVTRYFGPGQAVPASFTTRVAVYANSGTNISGTVTYTLQSGVEFINTP